MGQKKGSKKSEAWKKKVSESLKGRIPWNKGNKYTKEEKAKLYASRIGENNSTWNGGRYKSKQGYVVVNAYGHPNANIQHRLPEHRLIVEKHIGRYLTKGEEVHHINEVKDDNRIENLVLF